MILSEIAVPKMFTAYAEDKGYLRNGLHELQYFCEKCDQPFSVAWGKIPNSMSWFERGKYFHCPYCGEMHGPNVVYIKENELAPNHIRLSLKSYRNIVSLEITSETTYFKGAFHVYAKKCKEVIRFDIAKRTVLFTQWLGKEKKEELRLGNPFDLTFLQKSILRFFQPNCLAKKAEITQLLKNLRETIQEKLKNKLQRDVSSFFVSPGQCYGYLLIPIFNIAYRVVFPEMTNLPPAFRKDPHILRKFREMVLMTPIMAKTIKETLSLDGADYVTAMIQATELPDRPAIRRALNERPFDAGRLVAALNICKDYSNALRLYNALRQIESESFADFRLIAFLKKMSAVYSEAKIVQLVESAKEIMLGDCMGIYDVLNEENQSIFAKSKVRIRDLHDWLTVQHRKQTHPNYEFDIPEHIVKRMAMQTDRLNFFLPKESLELFKAGESLRNCVASYDRAVKDHNAWIVLVADDKGKLTACIEVRQKKIVQAKLYANKPVSQNNDLNAEVLAWAKAAKLEIATGDIKITEPLITNEIVGEMLIEAAVG